MRTLNYTVLFLVPFRTYPSVHIRKFHSPCLFWSERCTVPLRYICSCPSGWLDMSPKLQTGPDHILPIYPESMWTTYLLRRIILWRISRHTQLYDCNSCQIQLWTDLLDIKATIIGYTKQVRSRIRFTFILRKTGYMATKHFPGASSKCTAYIPNWHVPHTSCNWQLIRNFSDNQPSSVIT